MVGPYDSPGEIRIRMDDTVFSELIRKRSDRFPSAPAQLSRRDFGGLPAAGTEPHRQCYPFLAQAVVDVRDETTPVVLQLFDRFVFLQKFQFPRSSAKDPANVPNPYGLPSVKRHEDLTH